MYTTVGRGDYFSGGDVAKTKLITVLHTINSAIPIKI